MAQGAKRVSNIANIALALLLALMVAADAQSIVKLLGSWVIVGVVLAMAISMILGSFDPWLLHRRRSR